MSFGNALIPIPDYQDYRNSKKWTKPIKMHSVFPDNIISLTNYQIDTLSN